MSESHNSVTDEKKRVRRPRNSGSKDSHGVKSTDESSSDVKRRRSNADKLDKSQGDKSLDKSVARPKRTKTDELSEFKAWLTSLELGINPHVHINGPSFLSCVLVVDFGTPLEGIKMSSERSAELFAKMKNITKTVMNKEVKVSVMNDHNNGIWWTSVA